MRRHTRRPSRLNRGSSCSLETPIHLLLMRLSKILTAAAVFAVSGGSTLAAQQSSEPDFRPLEFLVGNCWTGKFPDGKQTDTHCFEWVYDRKFIRDRHVVRGGTSLYEGETIYAWDAKEKRVGYWYWSNTGLTVTGTVEYKPDSIVFPSSYSTEEGRVELNVVWTRPSADVYHVVQQQRVADGWKTLLVMDLKRDKREP
jgi:hypothetical protein